MTRSGSQSNVAETPLYIIAATLFVGLMAPYTVPIQIGATSQGLGLDPAQAGLLGSLEILAIAVTSILMATRVAIWSWRRMALWGASLAAVAQLSSAFTDTFLVLALCRSLAGMGAGCVLAAVNTVIAVSADPERMYGRVSAVMASAFALLLVVLPSLAQAGGHQIVYLLLAALVAGAIPLIKRLPNRQEIETQRYVEPARIPWGMAALLLLAMSFMYVSQGGIYSSTERIGTGLGIDPGTIGLMLSSSTLAGVCGAAIAGWMGTRWGRALPLLAGVFLSGAACLSIAFASNHGGYLFGVLLYGGVFLFTSPYVLGAAAALDPQGRLAAAAIGYQLIAYGMGPVIFGLVARDASYAATGWPGFAACLVAAVLFVPIIRNLRHKVRAAQVNDAPA